MIGAEIHRPFTRVGNVQCEMSILIDRAASQAQAQAPKAGGLKFATS